MSILSTDLLLLHAHAVDKLDAIRKAGELLVRGDRVLPDYVEGMLARERSMSTSLGNGVAIPHGLDSSRVYILKTGISVLQLDQAVKWDDEDTVSLVIGIAASADEHVGVLASLSEVIDDETKLAELFHTTDPNLVIQYLSAAQ